MLYSTITFNIIFAKYIVAKLRLLEFSFHQDVVTNCFDRRLIQNIADIASKCVARLQNAAIPITKCRNRYHKMRRYYKMTLNTNFCCLSVFAHFKDAFSLAMIEILRKFGPLQQTRIFHD